MTRIVIFCTKIFIGLLLSLLVISCNANMNFGESITGSGNVTKEVRKLSGFTKVEVSQGLDCEIQQSNNFAVIVEADDNLHEGIITTVENGVLKIKSEYDNYKNVKSKKVIVQMPKVVQLETSSGASLKTMNVITGNAILVKSSSGSEMNVEIESDTIRSESTSGSELILKGKALQLYSASSSGSTIEAGALMANNVNAQATSGSSTTVQPILFLDAKASSGSSIKYNKKPAKIQQESSSGGSVQED